MRQIHFPPPADPWSTNQDRQMHKLARYKRIQTWKESAAEHWVAFYGNVPIEGFVVIHLEIPFKVKRRRDPHNYCGTVLKACIDGLVVAGAIPDDNSEILGHREPVLKIGGDVVLSVELEGSKS